MIWWILLIIVIVWNIFKFINLNNEEKIENYKNNQPLTKEEEYELNNRFEAYEAWVDYDSLKKR